jgi:hypothetical protein
LFQYIALFLFLFLDIDECSSSSTYDCPANSNCTNNDGSYTCTCLSGFIKVGSLCQGTQFFSSVDSQFFMRPKLCIFGVYNFIDGGNLSTCQIPKICCKSMTNCQIKLFWAICPLRHDTYVIHIYCQKIQNLFVRL